MTESQLNLSNPDRPREIPCHGWNYPETLADVRTKGGHIEQVKRGRDNADYVLIVGWPMKPIASVKPWRSPVANESDNDKSITPAIKVP